MPTKVAEKACRKRAQHHADEGRRDEQRVLWQCREAGLQGDAEHGAGQINIETVEEHPDADQNHDAAVERADGQPVETAASID
jgi:hypothetical protein